MDADSIEDSPDSGAWGNITSLPECSVRTTSLPRMKWAAGLYLKVYLVFVKLKNLGSLTF